MARMSNRERIARAAEEARLADEEKLAKKKAKRVAKRPPKPRAKESRIKLVWVIYNAGGRPVKTFAYPDKESGANEAKRLSRATGKPHELRATRVPMD
jgi:hypothetical protein